MSYRHGVRRLVEPLAPALPALRDLRRAARREAFLVRIKTLALAVGATVEVDLAPDVSVDAVPRLEIYAKTWNRLRLAAGVHIGDGVRLSFRGGELDVGEHSDLRRLGTYQMAGTTSIGSGATMSNGVVIHCADRVSIDDWTIVGEYTTITDSSHRRTPAHAPVHHSSATKPVRIGRNVWVGAHAVITSGVTVGDQAFVGAGAVVTRDVQPGWLVGGVPARPLRELPEDPAG